MPGESPDGTAHPLLIAASLIAEDLRSHASSDNWPVDKAHFRFGYVG